jgi:hypothetical protein
LDLRIPAHPAQLVLSGLSSRLLQCGRLLQLFLALGDPHRSGPPPSQQLRRLGTPRQSTLRGRYALQTALTSINWSNGIGRRKAPNAFSCEEVEGSLRYRPTKDGVPTGIRTPVLTVKGWCPRPLDDGDAGLKIDHSSTSRLVEPGGIEPPTSCMPCKRSPS